VDSWSSDTRRAATGLKASPWQLVTSLITGWSVALIEVDIPWEEYSTINQIVFSYLNSVRNL